MSSIPSHDVPVSASGPGSSGVQRRMLARTASDPAIIADLAAQCLAGSEKRLSTLLACNTNVPVEILERIAHLIDYSDQVPVIQHRKHDPQALTGLLIQWPHRLRHEFLMASGAPHEVLLALVRALGWRSFNSVGLVRSPFITPDLVGEMWAHAVADASSLPPTAQAFLAQRIETKLGPDPRAVAIFEGLVGTFMGTVDELLDAVSAMVR